MRMDLRGHGWMEGRSSVGCLRQIWVRNESKEALNGAVVVTETRNWKPGRGQIERPMTMADFRE
jgi:hypothetical protein